MGADEKGVCFPLAIVLLVITECLAQNKGDVTYTPGRFCSLKGSSVTMRCTFTIPKGHILLHYSWYKLSAVGPPLNLKVDPEYKGRVEYLGDRHRNCTMRVTDLRETDSGVFSFQFETDVTPQMLAKDSGVRLNVTGLQIDWTSELVVDGQWAYLYCGLCILSINPTYIWYKDTQPLRYTNGEHLLMLDPVRMEDAGNYSCGLLGMEDSPGPPLNLLVGYGLKATSVAVSPPGETAEGGSVTLTCSSDDHPPADKYTWYKQNHSQAASWEVGSGPRYILLNVTSEDSGRYFCKTENKYQSRHSAPVRLCVGGKSGFSWAPVVGAVVGSVLAVGSILVIICLTLKRRRNTRISGEAHRFSRGKPSHTEHPDDTYATLDRSNMTPEYDTLANVRKMVG